MLAHPDRKKVGATKFIDSEIILKDFRPRPKYTTGFLDISFYSTRYGPIWHVLVGRMSKTICVRNQSLEIKEFR